MSDIESRGYVASAEDIEQITQSVLSASEHQAGGRTTYLRALIGTTQKRLGVKKAKAEPHVTEAETRRQLDALEEVQQEFYAAVLKAVELVPILEDERGKERNQVYNNRAVFARTAKSTLRAWLLSGNNIGILVPSKVTKYGLQAETAEITRKVRAPSERFLNGLTAKMVDRILLAKTKDDSVRLLEVVINRLVVTMLDLSADSVARLEDSLRSLRTLKEAPRRPPRRAEAREAMQA